MTEKKVCNYCKKLQDSSQFISMVSIKVITKHCLTCRLNVIKYSNKPGSQKYEARQHYKELKKNLPPCEICGDDDYYHKEFDHFDAEGKIDINNKKKGGVGEMNTIEDIDKEAKKCRCLCRKCHTKITVQRRKEKYGDSPPRELKKTKFLRLVADTKRKIGGCQAENCTDVFDPENLSFYEFDHIDCTTKIKDITAMTSGSYEMDILQKEIDKCVLLCAYCHYHRTRKQQKEIKETVQSLHVPTVSLKTKHPKITFEIAQKIRYEWITTNITQRDLFKKYNCSRSFMSDICCNKALVDPNYVNPKAKARNNYLDRIS